MSRFRATLRFAWSRRGLAVWVGALGVIVSVTSSVALFRRDRAHEQTRFQLLGNERVSAIQSEVNRPIESLVSACSVFDATGEDHEDRASAFASAMFEEFPQVINVHLGRMDDRTDRRSSVTIDSTWTRHGVIPIDFSQRQFRMLGGTSGQSSLSRPVQVADVVQLTDQDEKSRFVNVAMVIDWKNATAGDGDSVTDSSPVQVNLVANRNRAANGPALLLLTIDVNRSMTCALERMMPTGIRFELSPISVNSSVYAQRLREVSRNQQNPIGQSVTDVDRLQVTIRVADQPWQLTALAPESGIGMRSAALPWITLIAGLFVSGSLAGYVASIVGRASRIEMTVERRTQELQSVNEQLNDEVTQRKEAESSLSEYAAELEETNIELQATRDQMSKTLEELESRNQELDEFNYVASHDLQEPVRKLISFSTLLKQDAGTDLSEVALQDLHYIVDSAHRMRQLIKDLLAFSRTGRSALTMETVDLKEAAQAASDSLLLQIEETNADIRIEATDAVMGDFTLITQLMQNLISNAIKFCEHTRPTVTIRSKVENEECMTIVEDNGIGIRSKHTEKIFQPFQRLHARSRYDGNGIGLAICRKAVHRLGGRIWVESELGHGSDFVIALPLSPEEETATVEPVSTQSRQEAAPTSNDEAPQVTV